MYVKRNALGILLAMMMVIVGFSSCENRMSEPEQLEKNVVEEGLTRSSNVSDLPGWEILINHGAARGYKLYERGGNYLQKINLQVGAYLSVGTVNLLLNDNLPFSLLFPRTSIKNFWLQRPSKTLSVTNCQFFVPQDDEDTGTAACPLSYPVKNGGRIVSTGSTNDDGIIKRKLGISTATREAWVDSYTNTSNDASTVASYLQSPTVIVGTDPYLDERKPNYRIGRNMIGIIDQSEDGKKEVLYILIGVYSQSSSVNVLTGLGCNPSDIIMLDGSYSSQMMAEGVDKDIDYYSSIILSGIPVQKKRRNVPCVLYVRYR